MVDVNVRRATVAVLVLAGVLMSGADPAAAAPGGLDPTFGSGGIRIDDVDSGSSVDTSASDVAVQPDGKIVVAVSSYTDVGGVSVPGGFTLVRYNPDGTRDGAFGTNGVARAGFPGKLSSPSSIALQPNGRIVVAGSAETEVRGPFMAVARFGSDGKLDRTFSGDGRRLTTFDGCWGSGVAGIAIAAKGKIVVGGSAYCRQDRFAVARYTARGELDRSFSGDGKQTIAFRPPRNARHADARGYDLALQPDGKVIIVGKVDFWGGKIGYRVRVAVARLRANGSRDLGFGSNGVLSTRFGPASFRVGRHQRGAAAVRQDRGRRDSDGRTRPVRARAVPTQRDAGQRVRRRRQGGDADRRGSVGSRRGVASRRHGCGGGDVQHRW